MSEQQVDAWIEKNNIDASMFQRELRRMRILLRSNEIVYYMDSCTMHVTFLHSFTRSIHTGKSNNRRI